MGGFTQRGGLKTKIVRQDQRVAFRDFDILGESAVSTRIDERIAVTDRVISALAFLTVKAGHQRNNGRVLSRQIIADARADGSNVRRSGGSRSTHMPEVPMSRVRMERCVMIYAGVISPSISHRSSHVCPSFHKKTCPLIRRQFLSIWAIAAISSSVSGSVTAARRFAR